MARQAEYVERPRVAGRGGEQVLEGLKPPALGLRAGQHRILEEPVGVGLSKSSLREERDLPQDELVQAMAHVVRMPGGRGALG